MGNWDRGDILVLLPFLDPNLYGFWVRCLGTVPEGVRHDDGTCWRQPPVSALGDVPAEILEFSAFSEVRKTTPV